MSDNSTTMIEGPTKAAFKKLRERLLQKVLQQEMVVSQTYGQIRRDAMIASFILNMIQMEIGKIIGEVIDEC